MKLEANRVLITGGTSGIGRALAQAWHQRGGEVIVCGRDRERLAALARDYPGITGIRADITQEASRAELARRLGAAPVRPLVLVNNAAVQHPADWTQWSAGQATLAAEEITVNIAALVALTHAAWPALQAAPSATIVNLSSGLALAPRRSAPIYCATKAFVRSFSRGLRYQCEQSCPRIRVVEVLPPLVDTPMTAGRGRRKLAPAAVAQAILQGLEADAVEIPIGVARLLPLLQRVSPALSYRLLRNG